METPGHGIHAKREHDALRTATFGLGLALAAAAPYVMLIISFRIWPDSFDCPALVVDGILVSGLLSPITGVSGCLVGVSALRRATRNRERLIGIVAIVVSAVAVAATLFVMVNLAMWEPMPAPDVPY